MPSARDLRSSMLLATIAAGCSSLSSHVTTIEARGALGGESDSDDDHDDSYIGSPGTTELFAGGGNVEWRSYGLRGAIATSAIDVIVGADWHDFDGDGAAEANLGLRKRLSDTTDGLYFETALRHGFDLETAEGRQDYDGTQAGFGWILQLEGNWFVDMSCTLELTFDRMDVDGDKERLSDVLFNVGIGCVL